MHALTSLVLVGIPAAGAYYLSLRMWPYTRCRRCDGGGRNAGSNRNRWGPCRSCGGSGKRLRLGAKWVRR